MEKMLLEADKKEERVTLGIPKESQKELDKEQKTFFALITIKCSPKNDINHKDLQHLYFRHQTIQSPRDTSTPQPPNAPAPSAALYANVAFNRGNRLLEFARSFR